MKKSSYILHAIICFFLVAFDQVTKYLARLYLKEQPMSVLEGIFSFHYHENRGSVWGILQGKVDFLLLVSIVLFIVLIFAYIRIPKTMFYQPLIWILVFIMAGAIGNTIDRLFFGYVTDFLYFELINFPIFNIADCYITVCAFLTLFLVFTRYREDEFTFLAIQRKDTSHATDSDEN